MSPPSSLDQIGKSEVEPGTEIEKMGVAMYYLMSSAMNHAFYQKFVEIFLSVGSLVITKDEVEYDHVFGILQETVLGESPDTVLYDESNILLEMFTSYFNCHLST